MIDSGVLPSFWEGEIWRETHQFANIAHVLSAYETRWTRAGDVINRGVNSIQLFERDGIWLISAMIWRRDGKTIRSRIARRQVVSMRANLPYHRVGYEPRTWSSSAICSRLLMARSSGASVRRPMTSM